MQNPFNSYFIGGFECSDHINKSGERVNFLKETQHDVRVEEDYKLLIDLGIKTVREGICWSQVEAIKNEFDFSEVLNRIKIADKLGIQQIWDLVHFGYPDDLFPTHPEFCERFETLCREFVKFFKTHSEQALFVVPINEISFLSWYSDEARGTVPFSQDNGWDIKYQLCKAAISGIKILKEDDPTCTIILVEPLVKVHNNGSLNEEDLHRVNEYQFEVMDMISGKLCPELGGDESFLEIIGLNYYWNCQWIEGGEPIYWPDPESNREALSKMLSGAYERYNTPIFLSETGHFGDGRADWLAEINQECLKVKDSGIPFFGLCIYPVTDRPDWDNLDNYSNCGIFNLDSEGNRIPEKLYMECIKEQQDLHDNFYN